MLPWPLPSVCLPGLDKEIPYWLQGSWAGTQQDLWQLLALWCPRLPQVMAIHTNAAACSQDSETLRYPQGHSHIPIFLCWNGSSILMSTWAPQPLQTPDGDAMLQVWLFMEISAEPDAANYAFYVYFFNLFRN